MPRVESHVARTDLYNRGAKVPSDKTKSGYRIDRSKPADENDTLFCTKGTRYYTWSLMSGSRGIDYRSVTRPSRSQLTMSEFLGAMYDLEDGQEWISASSPEDLADMRDNLVQQLREIGEYEQEKLDNMPDGLREGDSGQLLESRAQACEDIASEFECIDLEDFEELDEDELRAELAEILELEDPSEVPVEEIDERIEEHLDEWIKEKQQELESVSWDYE